MGNCASGEIVKENVKHQMPPIETQSQIFMTDIHDSLQDIAFNIKEMRASFDTNVKIECRNCVRKDARIKELTQEVNKLKARLVEVYTGNMSCHDSFMSRSPTGV